MFEKLTRSQMFVFALPGLAVAWLIPPIYAIMGDFYLRYTEATAAGIGTAMIVSKMVDAVTDPPVGYYSDRTVTSWGSRKPWIAAGVLFCVPMFWFFFSPPENAGNLYFACGIIFYYLCYTLIKIPMRAWLGEIAPQYEDRSKVWSWFTIAMLVGGLLVTTLPLLLSSSLLPVFDSAEYDRDMISFLGVVGAVLLLATMSVSLKYVPQGVRNPGEPTPMKQFFDPLLQNAPFKLFLAGYGLSALGFGVFYSVVIVAGTSYWGFAERMPVFLLCMILIQTVSIPFWERVARHVPKHRVWAWAWLGHAFIMPLMLLFGADTPHFWWLVLVAGIGSVLQGPHMLFPVSIMNDVVDYDTLKFKTSRAGNLFALYTFIDKVLHAIGFGIGYYILAAFGYDAKLDVNSDWAVTGLMIAVIGVPAVLFFCSSLTLFRFTIDGRRHGIIRRRIEALASRNPA